MNTQGFDISDTLKSRWLHGSDCPPDGIDLTVAGARMHTFDDGNQTVVISFHETTQELSLNKTQRQSMAALFGVFTGAWIGQRIRLTPVPTQFAGKPTIMITRAAPPAPPTLNGQPVNPAPAAADNPFTTAPAGGVMFRQG